MVVNLQRQYLCGKRKQLWLPTSESRLEVAQILPARIVFHLLPELPLLAFFNFFQIFFYIFQKLWCFTSLLYYLFNSSLSWFYYVLLFKIIFGSDHKQVSLYTQCFVFCISFSLELAHLVILYLCFSFFRF